MFFSPQRRGWWGNPAVKDISVRQYNNDDTRLFDDIGRCSNVTSATYDLSESILELRDLEYILREASCYSAENVNGVLHYLGDALSYYLSRMHVTDASMLAKKSPQLLYEDMSLEDFLNAKEKLANCVDGMCKVNAAVIRMALKPFAESKTSHM